MRKLVAMQYAQVTALRCAPVVMELELEVNKARIVKKTPVQLSLYGSG